MSRVLNEIPIELNLVELSQIQFNSIQFKPNWFQLNPFHYFVELNSIKLLKFNYEKTHINLHIYIM
jgi:hypothetical protein